MALATGREVGSNGRHRTVSHVSRVEPITIGLPTSPAMRESPRVAPQWAQTASSPLPEGRCPRTPTKPAEEPPGFRTFGMTDRTEPTWMTS